MKIGYASNKFNRHSMRLQLKSLKKYGCEKIYKCSEFLELVYSIKPKDTLIIFNIAILGSMAEIMMITELMKVRKIELVSIT